MHFPNTYATINVESNGKENVGAYRVDSNGGNVDPCPPLNRDCNRDPNIEILERRGSLIMGFHYATITIFPDPKCSSIWYLGLGTLKFYISLHFRAKGLGRVYGYLSKPQRDQYWAHGLLGGKGNLQNVRHVKSEGLVEGLGFRTH